MANTLTGLVLRLVKGTPLTPQEGDNNLTLIQTFVNATAAQIGVSLNADGTLTAGACNAANQVGNSLFADSVLANTSAPVSVYAAGVYAVTNPGIAAYEVGMTVRFKADAVNAIGAASINVTGTVSGVVTVLGPKVLVKAVNHPLAAGDIQPGQIVEATYDGTNFQLLNLSASSTTTASRNLAVTVGSVTTISAAADEVVVKDVSGSATLLFNVNVSAAINAGVVPGGLDAGTAAAATWYYLFVIWNGTSATGLLSLSKTAPVLPTGYGAKALVGAVYNNSTVADLQHSITYGGVTKFKSGLFPLPVASGPQLPTLNAASSVLHNLGAVPSSFRWFLVNVTPEAGYAAGDTVAVSEVFTDNYQPAAGEMANVNVLNCAMFAAAGGINIPLKDGSGIGYASAAITAGPPKHLTNWNLLATAIL